MTISKFYCIFAKDLTKLKTFFIMMLFYSTNLSSKFILGRGGWHSKPSVGDDWRIKAYVEVGWLSATYICARLMSRLIKTPIRRQMVARISNVLFSLWIDFRKKAFAGSWMLLLVKGKITLAVIWLRIIRLALIRIWYFSSNFFYSIGHIVSIWDLLLNTIMTFNCVLPTNKAVEEK